MWDPFPLALEGILSSARIYNTTPTRVDQSYIHTLPDGFTWRHGKLFGIVWTAKTQIRNPSPLARPILKQDWQRPWICFWNLLRVYVSLWHQIPGSQKTIWKFSQNYFHWALESILSSVQRITKRSSSDLVASQLNRLCFLGHQSNCREKKEKKRKTCVNRLGFRVYSNSV